MPKNTSICTEEIFQKEIEKKLSESKVFWNLGGNLFLEKRRINGKCNFLVRVQKNGKDTKIALGNYNDGMTYTEARTEADSIRRKFETQREKQRVIDGKVKVNQLIKEPMRSKTHQLVDINSAREMKSKLLDCIYDRETSQPDREIYVGVLLALLVPSRNSAVFNLSWKDINLDHHSLQFRGFEKKPNKVKKLINDYNPIGICIEQILKNFYNTCSTKLFPNLTQHSQSEQKSLINSALDKINTKKLIRVSQFKAFFRDMAVKHSDFKESFINSFLSNQTTIYSTHISSSHILQYWWESQIFPLGAPYATFPISSD